MASVAIPTSQQAPQGIEGFFKKLSEIQIGGGGPMKIKRKDLVYIFRNLATLLENGLSLAKALSTLRAEKALKRYFKLFDTLERSVQQGSTLSSALQKFPGTFSDLMLNQIKIGEQTGTLVPTIARLTKQLENGSQIRSMIIKKLTYPALLSTAGSGAVTFMILVVVPTFQKMYSESKAKLPAITEFLIVVGDIAKNYLPVIVMGGVAAIVGAVTLFRNPTGRQWIDGALLKIPLVEAWVRSIAVLQFTEVLGNMMEAGFTLADALPQTAKGITNTVVKRSVQEMHAAVLRGERFSKELERRADIFPPVVLQLVVIGERTGCLTKTTRQIREHLQREVERYTAIMLGAIEPIMTFGLATVIGGILLAVYLPMFDMIGAMNH